MCKFLILMKLPIFFGIIYPLFLEKEMAFLSGKSHGQRGLVGHGPWGSKELDVTAIKSEREMATHSSILTWRIPWTEKPGGLLSLGLHRVRHDWSHLARIHAPSLFILFVSIFCLLIFSILYIFCLFCHALKNLLHPNTIKCIYFLLS